MKFIPFIASILILFGYFLDKYVRVRLSTNKQGLTASIAAYIIIGACVVQFIMGFITPFI